MAKKSLINHKLGAGKARPGLSTMAGVKESQRGAHHRGFDK